MNLKVFKRVSCITFLSPPPKACCEFTIKQHHIHLHHFLTPWRCMHPWRKKKNKMGKDSWLCFLMDILFNKINHILLVEHCTNDALMIKSWMFYCMSSLCPHVKPIPCTVSSYPSLELNVHGSFLHVTSFLLAMWRRYSGVAALQPLISVAGEGDSTIGSLAPSVHAGFLERVGSYLPFSLLNGFPASILHRPPPYCSM